MTGQPPRSADELLDIVDERDRVVGRAPRGEAYARRLRHRCVFVLVRDAEGRIFVHRRTEHKLVFPSRYDMFVGGVVGAGETYDAAALREAEEELGVTGLPAPQALFAFRYETPEHAWWSAIYQVRCELPVHPQPEEVAWHAFLTEAELERRLAAAEPDAGLGGVAELPGDAPWRWVPDGVEAYRRLRALPTGGPAAPA